MEPEEMQTTEQLLPLVYAELRRLAAKAKSVDAERMFYDLQQMQSEVWGFDMQAAIRGAGMRG